MAVIAKFVVVRDGVELEQVFTDRKEAEAYDKLLDAAQEIVELIKQGDLKISIDPKIIDTLAIFLAENAPAVTRILKAVKPITVESVGIPTAKPKVAPADDKANAQEPAPKSKSKAA